MLVKKVDGGSISLILRLGLSTGTTGLCLPFLLLLLLLLDILLLLLQLLLLLLLLLQLLLLLLVLRLWE